MKILEKIISKFYSNSDKIHSSNIHLLTYAFFSSTDVNGKLELNFSFSRIKTKKNYSEVILLQEKNDAHLLFFSRIARSGLKADSISFFSVAVASASEKYWLNRSKEPFGCFNIHLNDENRVFLGNVTFVKWIIYSDEDS